MLRTRRLPRVVLPIVLPVLLAAAAAARPGDAQLPEAAPIAASAPLFASHELLELTLIADFAALEDDRAEEDNPERPALLRLHDPAGNVVELPLDVRTRGFFRLRRSTCAFPNLRFDFPSSSAALPTVFAGQDRLKLVSHCRDDDEYEQNLLEEYLAYRLYNLLTEESFRVRLARITYQDVTRRKETITRYAFLIENAERLAERLGGVYIEIQGANPQELDGPSSARVELFEYMIGNTDFSIVNFHNMELVRMPDATYHPIPYDFDFSGFVDAPYATPSAVLPLRSVRERLYRGYCHPGVDMTALFDSFLAQREAAARLIQNQAELAPQRAERAIRYLDDFFDTIDSPRARRNRIERACRTAID